MTRTDNGKARRSARIMAGMLAGMGVLHFVVPEKFDKLIVPELPGEPRQWTLGSGWAELGTAALLAFGPTQRLGAKAAMALFVGVFPGNLQMARDSAGKSGAEQAIAFGRLPLQIPLVLWANRLRRNLR